MKYIIKTGNCSEEFEGEPEEIIKLKSSLERTEELRKAIRIAIENNNKKITDNLIEKDVNLNITIDNDKFSKGLAKEMEGVLNND